MISTDFLKFLKFLNAIPISRYAYVGGTKQKGLEIEIVINEHKSLQKQMSV